MCRLGWLYESGQGVEQSWEKAYEWYRKSAEAGNDRAMGNLAFCYEFGYGVSRDLALAVQWYRKGAEAGNARCMFCMGWNYAEGNGVERDVQQALAWYQKAAEKGYAKAMYNLGWHYYNGVGVAQDDQQAVYWYQKAADAGHSDAMNNLGECYAHGRGVARDLDRAMALYQKAAECGNIVAEFNLGWHLEQMGRMDEAYRYYRIAADGGEESAWWALGRFYEAGDVVERDEKEAFRCYEKGRDLGSVKCAMRIGRCKLLGIGTRKAKKHGLELCRSALEQARTSDEKEDYGYEAEVALLEKTILENE